MTETTDEPALQVLKSGNGYFIGTRDERGPNRLSFEYWKTPEAALRALATESWSPRNPLSSGWCWGEDGGEGLEQD